MHIQNFEQWLTNHKDQQQKYISSGRHELAIKTCFLCCEELLQKKHHFTDDKNAQALDFFCTQLSVLGKKESASLTQIETNRQLYRASIAFQQLAHTVQLVNTQDETSLKQLTQAYFDFFSLLNREWLRLLNNSDYQKTLFSMDPYHLSSELQLIAHLRLLAAIIEHYIKHHSQFLTPIILESNKDLTLQLKLYKVYIRRFLTNIYEHLIKNASDLEKLSGDNVLLLMRLNFDTTEVLDKQYCGNANNTVLYGKYLCGKISMDKDERFTQAAENILRQGYPQTRQAVATSTSQPANVDTHSAFAERIRRIGLNNDFLTIGLNVVSDEKASDIILSELQRRREYIEREHRQFVQRLQSEPQNSEQDAWTSKTTRADLYLYYINTVALIRFYLNRNDFARASKSITALDKKLEAVLEDREAYFTAFVAFNPRQPLLQKYCYTLTAAADGYFDIFSKHYDSFRLCLRDNFKSTFNECLVKLPKLILLNHRHIDEENFGSAEENLKQLIEKINQLLHLTTKDFQGMPEDVVSQQDINKIYLVAIDFLMKWVLHKAKRTAVLEDKRKLYHFAHLLATAADAFLALKYLEDVSQSRHIQLSIAKSKFYSQFHIQHCNDSETFNTHYQRIREFNKRIFNSLLNPVDQFELLIAEFLYLNSIVEVDDANVKQKALLEHLHDLQLLIEANAVLSSEKKYQIQFHFVANLCYFSGTPDYNQVITHSRASLQALGQPTQFESPFDYEYFLYSSCDHINAHIGLVRDESTSEEQQADKTRALLRRLFSCLEESWFFSTDYNTFRGRLSPYAKSKKLLKLIAEVINISIDTLLQVNNFAIQHPNDLLFNEQAFRDFTARMAAFINLVHTFTFHEIRNGKLFDVSTYIQLSRLHIYALLLCDLQYPALLRINELQTFCDNDLIKSKSPNLDTEAIEGLSLTLTDLNTQLTMLARHAFLTDRNHLLPILSFIDTYNYFDSLRDEAPKPLTHLQWQLSDTVKIPALQQYCRFVYGLSVTRYYYNRQDKSNFLTAFKRLQSDATEIANLNLQDIRYHFYMFLQPQLMCEYLICRSYSHLLENQYALAASCVDTIKDLSSESYVFDELADIYDLKKLDEEDNYLQDLLSQLICMVQKLRISLEYDSAYITLQLFIQQSQEGDPKHGENPAQSIWQQLPVLDKSTQPIDKSSAQELLPFIDECLISFTLACTAYLQTDSKRTAKKSLLNINHLKNTHEALFPYLSREQDELFKKLIKKIEQNIKQNNKEKKSKKDQPNTFMTINADSTEDIDSAEDAKTAPITIAVSAAKSKIAAASTAPQIKTTLVPGPIPKQQLTRTHALKTASPNKVTQSPAIFAKSSSMPLSHTDGKRVISRDRYPLKTNNKTNRWKNRQANLGNHKSSEVAGAPSLPLAKRVTQPTPNPNAQELNSNTRILHPSSPILAKQEATRLIRSNGHTLIKLVPNTELSDLSKSIYATTGIMPSYAAVAKGLNKKNPMTTPPHVQDTCDISSQSSTSVDTQSTAPCPAELLESLKATTEAAVTNLAYWSIEHNNIITLYNAYATEWGYHILALNVHLEALDILGYRLQLSELQKCYYLQKIKLNCLDLSKPFPLNQEKAANSLIPTTIRGTAELLSRTNQMKEMPLPNNPVQLSSYHSQVQALIAQLCHETQIFYRHHESLVADLNRKNHLLQTCIEALQIISTLGIQYEIRYNIEEARPYLTASKACELTKILRV